MRSFHLLLLDAMNLVAARTLVAMASIRSDATSWSVFPAFRGTLGVSVFPAFRGTLGVSVFPAFRGTFGSELLDLICIAILVASRFDRSATMRRFENN